MAIRAKTVRLVIAHPHQLGRGEAGHRHDAGDQGQARQPREEARAFRLAARIVPQDGRAERPVIAIECDHRMHLAGEADRSDPGHCAACVLRQPRERVADRIDPGRRVLFAMTGSGPERRVAAGGVGDDVLVVVDDDRLHAPTCRCRCRDTRRVSLPGPVQDFGQKSTRGAGVGDQRVAADPLDRGADRRGAMGAARWQ